MNKNLIKNEQKPIILYTISNPIRLSILIKIFNDCLKLDN